MTEFVVTSAKELSAERKKKIAEKLGVKVNDVLFLVDEGLIGGIVISDGEKVLDASVKGKLREAKKQTNSFLSEKPLDHILRDLKEECKRFDVKSRKVKAGVVRSITDGVLFVDGLEDAKIGELLLISDAYFAMVMNLTESGVGAILLTGDNNVRAGDLAETTDRIVTIPVGEEFLGRVVDPLGAPLDGKGPIKADGYRRAENPAPGIFDRAKVDRPLYTGIKTIDSIVPIGKGQRELVIGDRQTGKTALCLDAILNQKGKGVYCVYVAIGQKSTTVSDVVKRLKEFGAMDYTIVVSSTASDSAPLQYIAPYAATAMAEEFSYKGKDVLIVYDDLSKHAVAYRAISLLLKRPAGREAYPGDVFYIHSRLLERSAALSPSLGGGSLTALPIIETLGSDISSYIPTNVISITDGQIFLEAELFHAGVRPAVNVGLSVSRVGGSAQCSAMRKVSKGLKLDLARYREMAVFTQFGADVDEDTRSVLDKGAKLTNMLIQPQFAPYSMAEEIVEIYLISNGAAESVSPAKVRPLLDELMQSIKSEHKEILEEIEKTGELSDASVEALDRLIASIGDEK